MCIIKMLTKIPTLDDDQQNFHNVLHVPEASHIFIHVFPHNYPVVKEIILVLHMVGSHFAYLTKSYIFLLLDQSLSGCAIVNIFLAQLCDRNLQIYRTNVD